MKAHINGIYVGNRIIDVYGNKGKIVDVFYDYVRLDSGKAVYKNAIALVLCA